MRKAAIITIYDEANSGNRLQNYAVQEVLKRHGLDPVTLRNIRIVDGINYLDEAKKINPKRREKFLNFNKNIIVSNDIIYHDRVPEDLKDRYDMFVIGSDQVWNWDFQDRFSEFSFGSFAPKEKVIAYAASFGIDFIDDKHIDEYKKIDNISKISVREKSGLTILANQFSIRNAVHVIDPTMMLTGEEWLNVCTKPEVFPDRKYIFTYFLGNMSDERRKAIDTFARENDYEIVDFSDENGKYYYSGPSEFVYYIANAEAILCDSFHACAFSIVFNKPFTYMPREGATSNMSTRLVSLFDMFKIDNGILIDNDIASYKLIKDYDKINPILDEKREEANEFLRDALKEE